MIKWHLKALVLIFLSVLIAFPPLINGFILLSRAENASNAQDASRDYESAAKFLFWRTDLYEQAGLLAEEEPQRAIQLLEMAKEKEVLTALGQIALGDAFLADGHPDQAISEWNDLLTNHQNIKDISPRLADIYHLRQEYDKEKALLEIWLEAEPSNPGASQRLGILISASADPKALPLLITASTSSTVINSRLETLIAALKLDPGNPAFRLASCGQALANLNEWKLAEQAFSLAVSENPLYAEAWAWLGLARQHENTPGALPALEKAQQLDPNSAAIHAMLGTFWLQAGKPKYALLQFSTSTKLEPGNPAWWVARANAASHSDLADALDSFTRAVNLAPKDAGTWYALATFCVENNVYIEDYGLNAALRAFALDPNNPDYMDMLGRAQMATDQSAAAEVMFKRALENDQASSRAYIFHFHLALLYLQTNQPDQAKFELSQTKVTVPQGSYGAQAQKLIERYFP